MKKLSLLFAIAFLLQSCFSYKTIENDPSRMETGEKYQIGRNNKNHKITFNSLTDSSIIVTKRNLTKEEIPIKEITSIQKRKFSIIKTIAFPTAVVVAITGLFALSYN
ncbi:MAG: hypothetical protein QM710_08270 [Flavobacterium sp.]